MMNLLMAPMHTPLKIVKVKNGRGYGSLLKNDGECDHKNSRLTSLGFIEGSVIEIVNKVEDSFIVKIKMSKIAIGKGVALKVMVVPVMEEGDEINEIE